MAFSSALQILPHGLSLERSGFLISGGSGGGENGTGILDPHENLMKILNSSSEKSLCIYVERILPMIPRNFAETYFY